MKTTLVLLISLFISNLALAGDWSFNLGYNNPPGSTVGLNFMDLGSQWAFEFGVGGIQSNNQGNSSTSVLGDINFKYLFGGSGVRPYIQVGAGSAATVTTGSGTTANVGIGGVFGGVGIMAVGRPLYIYLSGDVGGNSNFFFQAGVGYSF